MLNLTFSLPSVPSIAANLGAAKMKLAVLGSANIRPMVKSAEIDDLVSDWERSDGINWR